VSRLASIAQNLNGTTYDATTTFGYTPASQIASQTRTNDAYAWGGYYNVARGYTSNGLNQLTAAGATSLGYDARGNLTSSGSSSYGYSSENLLTSAPGSVTLSYDPALRLYQSAGASTTKFQYDGTDMIAEYDSAGTLQKRYVFGPGADEPLVEYAGTGTSSRTFLHADERGSIVARSDSSGNETAINSYDEYGVPASGNAGRFQYTGQQWLSDLGMYYYKARIYSPTLGRFMQTDPIGYGDGLNWYNYVMGDPINASDPTGLTVQHLCWLAIPLTFSPDLDGDYDSRDIVVTGRRSSREECRDVDTGGSSGLPYGPGTGAGLGGGQRGGGDTVGTGTPQSDNQSCAIGSKLVGTYTDGKPICAKPQDPSYVPLREPRLPNGDCPAGTVNGNRAGCLTPAGQDEMRKGTCQAFAIPLIAGTIVFAGPEILTGRALLSGGSAGMRILTGASVVQSLACF